MVRKLPLELQGKRCSECNESIFVYVTDGHIYCEICENYVSELI